MKSSLALPVCTSDDLNGHCFVGLDCLHVKVAFNSFGQLVCSDFCCDIIFLFEKAPQIYVCLETPYCCFHTFKVNPPPSFAGNDIVIIFPGLEGDIHGAFWCPYRYISPQYRILFLFQCGMNCMMTCSQKDVFMPHVNVPLKVLEKQTSSL